jgi:hypothetical protein
MLRDLSREELEAKALKLGVEFTSKTPDERLIKRIRVALEAVRSEKAGRKSAVLPADWSPDMLSEYYQQIVGHARPLDDGEAYARLLKVCDEKAKTEKVPREKGDCFGLFFDPNLKLSCMGKCPHMPLCKRVMELRPDLKTLAEELDRAVDEAEKVTPEEAAAAVKPATKPAKVKAEKPKKAEKVPELYRLKAELSAYNLEPDLLKVYKWMKKQRGFSADDLRGQLAAAGYPDPKSFARETIDWLVGEGDLVPADNPGAPAPRNKRKTTR